MAPRSIWNGTISLRLVARAREGLLGDRVQDRPLPAGPRARRRAHRAPARLPKEGEEVPYDEIVKGYEVSEGEFVELDEGRGRGRRRRAQQADRRSRTSSTRARSTRSSSTRPTTSARATTARTPTGCCTTRSSSTGRAGIGRWIFHDREYLVAVRALERRAGAAHDALPRRGRRPRRPRRCPSRAQARPSARSRWRARSSSRCTTDFEPEMYEDTYREARARRASSARRKGKEIDARGAASPRTASTT